jgi:acetyl-CoA carboxylase biotin carboxyl carrier protein
VKTEELEAIIKILKQNDVSEFELNNNGTHIKLSRAVLQAGATRSVVQPVVPITMAHSAEVIPTAAPAAQSEIPSNWVKVESPIVGTFYSKPGPDKEAFVSEGKTVKKGDTLCIIEAMKLMNEIEAPCAGKVEKILIQDSTVVEYGEVLFFINPSK